MHPIFPKCWHFDNFHHHVYQITKYICFLLHYIVYLFIFRCFYTAGFGFITPLFPNNISDSGAFILPNFFALCQLVCIVLIFDMILSEWHSLDLVTQKTHIFCTKSYKAVTSHTMLLLKQHWNFRQNHFHAIHRFCAQKSRKTLRLYSIIDTHCESKMFRGIVKWK